MLKIKDNIDLKDLEKFGFELINYDGLNVYHKRTNLADIKAIDYYIIKK